MKYQFVSNLFREIPRALSREKKEKEREKLEFDLYHVESRCKVTLVTTKTIIYHCPIARGKCKGGSNVRSCARRV